jgi:hypothetical protein
MGRIAFLLLALFAEMERTFTTERAAHARTVAEAAGRWVRQGSVGNFQVGGAVGIQDPDPAEIARVAADHELRLLRQGEGMPTGGAMPEYLFRRTRGVIGLLGIKAETDQTHLPSLHDALQSPA